MKHISQKTLSNEERKINNPVIVYSKQVKGKSVNSSTIEDHNTREKMIQLVRSLLRLGKTRNIDELTGFKENCRVLIESILNKYPKIEERDVKLLLFDFTDSMKTVMREEEKYAIVVMYDEGIFLAHSEFGEQTITPEWQIVRRMLDKDNVIRFANFAIENNSIKVTYYEKTRGSESFATWLGLSEKEAFYWLGGKYRVQTEIEGIHVALEFTDEEIETKFIDGDLEVKDNQIILKKPVKMLPIIQVRAGKAAYVDINDFIQDFYAKKYDVRFYQDKYTELRSSNLPYMHKFIDERERIVYFEGDEEKIYLRKRNPNFYVIFSDDIIDIRNSFIADIAGRVINNQEIKVFHAGSKFCHQPIEIKSLKIFNLLDLSETAKSVIKWFNETELTDTFVNNVLHSSIIYLLSLENQEKPITHFLKRLFRKLQEFLSPRDKFTIIESLSLELKSRSYFEGKDKDIAARLVKDIKSKLSKQKYKVYIIGADQKTQTIEPLSSSRLDHDRLRNIEQKIREKVELETLHLYPVTFDRGKKGLLILIVGGYGNV